MKKISLKKSVAAASAAVMMLAGVPALAASAASSNTYSDTYKYYSNVTGLYYDTLEEAMRVSNTSNTRYVYPYYNYYYGYNYNNYYYNYEYPYYSSYTKSYYRTYSEAVTASNNNSSYVTYVGNGYYGYYNGYSYATPYYSTVTNKYYGTYEEAFKASNNRGDYVIYYGSNSGTAYYPGYSYVNYSNYRYPYYYYSDYYYYDAYGRYYDPAYYWYNSYYYTAPKTTKTTTVRNSSNVEASAGIPYFKGYKKIWGWTVISDRIANSSLRSSTTIMMNGATNLPTEFLKAAKAKETNLKLVLANGVTWDISGTHIGDVEETNIDVVYGTENVPDYLVKAATQDAVSCAQITVGEGTKTLGFTGTATVKFPSTRADCFVKAYVYDPQEDNLKLVDKTIIDAHGHAKLALKYSGNYLLVLS